MIIISLILLINLNILLILSLLPYNILNHKYLTILIIISTLTFSYKNLAKKIIEYSEKNSISKDTCIYGDIYAKEFLTYKNYFYFLGLQFASLRRIT